MRRLDVAVSFLRYIPFFVVVYALWVAHAQAGGGPPVFSHGAYQFTRVSEKSSAGVAVRRLFSSVASQASAQQSQPQRIEPYSFDEYRCGFCNMTMQYMDTQRHAGIHQKQATESPPLSCSNCGFRAKGSNTHEELAKHYETRQQCKHCSQTVPCREQWEHESICQERTVPCPGCKTVMKVQDLAGHISAQSGTADHERVQCGFCTMQIDGHSFVTHMKLYHDPSHHLARRTHSKDCPWCEEASQKDNTFPMSDSELLQHAASTHSQQYIELMNKKEISQNSSPKKQALWHLAHDQYLRREQQETEQALEQLVRLQIAPPSHDGRLLWDIPDFSSHRERAKKEAHYKLMSPPFYTSPYGYKLALEVYPNGQGDAYGSHLSVFFVIMKGKYDDHLAWPFSSMVLFRLRNQNDPNPQKGIMEKQNIGINSGSTSVYRPVLARNTGTGSPRFVSHSQLQEGEGFLKNDKIILECQVDMESLKERMKTL